MAQTVEWSGSAPEYCDICAGAIGGTFIDGATQYGPWACMCSTCHGTHGRGLGTGRGQKYQQKEGMPGRWFKVEG